MRVYYNENDHKKCAALYQLMQDGHIRKGDIDDRSIRDVQGSDIDEYERCHFFAGIGLWDYALDLARWKKGDRVWTGSCPCQPYSAAGKQKGQADDRHLWPEWFRLIKECQPPTIFGEQVANAVSFGWLDEVYQGLEEENYAVGWPDHGLYESFVSKIVYISTFQQKEGWCVLGIEVQEDD